MISDKPLVYEVLYGSTPVVDVFEDGTFCFRTDIPPEEQSVEARKSGFRPITDPSFTDQKPLYGWIEGDIPDSSYDRRFIDSLFSPAPVHHAPDARYLRAFMVLEFLRFDPDHAEFKDVTIKFTGDGDPWSVDPKSRHDFYSGRSLNMIEQKWTDVESVPLRFDSSEEDRIAAYAYSEYIRSLEAAAMAKRDKKSLTYRVYRDLTPVVDIFHDGTYIFRNDVPEECRSLSAKVFYEMKYDIYDVNTIDYMYFASYNDVGFSHFFNQDNLTAFKTLTCLNCSPESAHSSDIEVHFFGEGDPW